MLSTQTEHLQEEHFIEKARDIVRLLTLEEKIGMIHGAQLFETAGVPRLGIPPLRMSDGPMGVRQSFEADSWHPINHSDDYVTYLPCNSALAATWNRNLAYEMGLVLGEEARGRGKDVILAPGINIKRSPLCGRNFEYFSEDPYLTAEMAVPLILGIQKNDVAACVKHFAVNNQETDRLAVEVKVDEAVLREIYLPAFHAAITKGNAYAIMGAYNKLYGEFCCHNQYLLGKILREEWNYQSLVVSDWGGVHDTKEASLSPLDIEMSVTNNFDDYFMAKPLKEKVEAGIISEQVIDEKVTHILMLMMRLHMLEDKDIRKSGCYNTPMHREKACLVANESIVLLKNEMQRLPLVKEKLKRILVIGDNAESIHSNGGGSSEIKALYEISPLMGLKSQLGGNVEVKFVRGYCRTEEEKQEETNWQETSLEEKVQTTKAAHNHELIEKQRQLKEEAVALASQYEEVIFVGGLNHYYDSEGVDREDMKLPYGQDDLIKALLEVNPRMVIVLMGGSPVEMNEWIDRAQCLVWSWYGGIEGGNALANVLLGHVNPSGKLPETFYKKHTDCSAHVLGEFGTHQTVSYDEGVFVGYRYNDTYHVSPQFCFGHGLSYTTFKYTHPKLIKQQDRLVVSCEITNIGSRAGQEVVQVYAREKKRSANRPLQALEGFEKVNLQAGETKTVTIDVAWHSKEPLKTYHIGSSSRDIRLVIEGNDMI